MNKTIQAVATIMIILLLVALIWIFLSYYRKNDTIDTISYPGENSNVSTPGIPNTEYISNNTEKHDYDNLIESIQNMSGEKEINKGNEETLISGELQPTIETSGDDRESIKDNVITGKINQNPNTIPEESNNQSNPSNQLVISSTSETSNEEKQEVLTEIDEALKGLLEAVGKVQIVDEKRLDASLNSEVEIP